MVKKNIDVESDSDSAPEEVGMAEKDQQFVKQKYAFWTNIVSVYFNYFENLSAFGY